MTALLSVVLAAGCSPAEQPASPDADGVQSAHGSAVGLASSAPPAVSAAPSASTPAPPRAPADGMAKIPGGKLKMGRDDGKKSEAPAHEVTVKDFFIDTREVTVAAYRECVAAKKCPEPTDDEFCNFHKKDRDNHPINCVDFKSAEAFCAFVGKRLPTEQEWERAARGDDGRKYPWGAEEPNMDLLCWKRLKEKLGTCEVGSRPKGASPYGVLDMAGNVNEWTSTKYCPYATPSCETEEHSGRGGSWDYSNADNVTTTTRAGGKPTHARDLLGLRCAKDG